MCHFATGGNLCYFLMTVMLMLMMYIAMGGIYRSSCVTLPQVDIYAVFDSIDANDWLCKCKQYVIMDDTYSIYQMMSKIL